VGLLLLFSLSDDVFALVDFSLPELLYGFELILLLEILKVWWNFIQEESTIVFVTVSHELFVVVMLKVLESAIHEWTCGKVEGKTWLV
jgi:hypothetical protein